MQGEETKKPTHLCPTCGTRLASNAQRCLVCGTPVGSKKGADPSKALQGSHMPMVTMSLPVALLVLALLLSIGAVGVFYALRGTGRVIEPTPVPTNTLTPTPSLTPTPVTPTPTNTPEPSPTPISYVVASGDNCLTIAYTFSVSVQSIVMLNSIPAACDTLIVGQTLLIPHPTPTTTPLPTATLSPAEATEQACQKVDYEVKETDTLSRIAANYGLTILAIKTYNGLIADTVYAGQTLRIPLCERTIGPTPTPTQPPPYPSPNLLLPADGTTFDATNETVTLQWASVGTLRSNEAYAVTIENIGDGRTVAYVTDTKYIVPTSLRPVEAKQNIFRWWVISVRIANNDEEGNPIWEPAGASSLMRVFSWTGGKSPPTQAP